jgi:riboflavin kinase/FMN adenylyltransferase
MAPGKHVVPAHGVYAAWAHLAGQRYRAVVNIGVRPTFGGRAPTLETHLLDYGGGDFYGARLGVDFVARLRPELKFPSVETLSAQIRADVALARTRLVVRPRGLFSPEE